MLEEAIVEAKTIKEAAIANAKSILEEAFTPTLMASFANQLNEMEFEEEEMMNGIDEMNDIDEMYDSVDEVDDNFDLEEILRELESNNEELDSDSSLDENLMLEKMDDEDIEELVMQTIKDMIKDGTIAKGPNSDEDEDEDQDEEDIDFSDFDEEDVDTDADGDKKMKMDDEEEVNIDELLKELQFISEEDDEDDDEPANNPKLKAAAERNHEEYSIMKEELKAALKAVNELRTELNEVNLLNAKLLYTNKIFKAKNLTESEKVKVLNTFDKAETVKEVKLVFETLTESFKATAKKSPIKESLGSASKMITTATPKQPIIEVNDAFARMQKLAGLRK